VEQNPDDAEAISLMASNYESQGNLVEAMKRYEQLGEFDSSNRASKSGLERVNKKIFASGMNKSSQPNFSPDEEFGDADENISIDESKNSVQDNAGFSAEKIHDDEEVHGIREEEISSVEISEEKKQDDRSESNALYSGFKELQGEGVPVDSVLEEGRLDEETADQEKISHSLDELAPEADFDEAPEGFSEEDESAEEFFAQPVVVKKVVEEKPRAKFETENLGDDEDLTEEIREVKTTEKAEFVPEEEAEEIQEEFSEENSDEENSAEEFSDENLDGEDSAEEFSDENSDGEDSAEEISDENLDDENSAEEISDENLDDENSAEEISDENLDDKNSAEEIGDENLDGEDSAEEFSDENLDGEDSAEEIGDENPDEENSAEEFSDENPDEEDSAEEFSDENLDGENSAEELSDENLDGENSADEIPTVEDVLEKSEAAECSANADETDESVPADDEKFPADDEFFMEEGAEKSEGNSAAKLFEKLKSLSDFLPDEKKSDFMESRNRLRLEYVISRLHGKRGLLKTAESMRKGETVGNESESGFFLLLKVLNIMDVLSSGLQDENLASAAAKEIEKLKSKLV
jgi:hypothetical protein